MTFEHGSTWTMAGGSMGTVQGDANILLTGTDAAHLAAMWFGQYSLAAFVEGGRAVFANADLLIGSQATLRVIDDAVLTVAASSSTSPAKLVVGANGVLEFRPKSTVTGDAKVTARVDFVQPASLNFKNAQLTLDKNSQLLVNAAMFLFGPMMLGGVSAPILTAPSPAPTDAPGANTLQAVLQIKAWCVITILNGTMHLDDGANIAKIDLADGHYPSGDLVVWFATAFDVPSNYLVFGLFVAPPDALVIGLGVPAPPIYRSPGACQLRFGQVLGANIGASGTLNMSQSTGTLMILFLGRQ
jgi:hypothetical protein